MLCGLGGEVPRSSRSRTAGCRPGDWVRTPVISAPQSQGLGLSLAARTPSGAPRGRPGFQGGPTSLSAGFLSSSLRSVGPQYASHTPALSQPLLPGARSPRKQVGRWVWGLDASVSGCSGDPIAYGVQRPPPPPAQGTLRRLPLVVNWGGVSVGQNTLESVTSLESDRGQGNGVSKERDVEKATAKLLML